MLEASRRRILQTVADDALILDVGGWAVPFPRADWVIDLAPYETRGAWGYDGEPDAERFTAQTYVQRDICDREPWPFEDGRFDFVICSHTLEDIRDPVWVCSELNRIGKAGYIEVPSRLEEQSYGFQGPWVGWGHHHWLADITPGRIEFTFKHHIINRSGSHFPAGFHDRLRPEECVQMLWWEQEFGYGERFYETPRDIDRYFESFVEEQMALRPPLTAPSGQGRKGLANRIIRRVLD